MGEANRRGTFEERKAQATKKRSIWASVPWPLRVLILAGLWFVFSYGLPK